MRNYDRVHPRKPEGIDQRHAYIVGGGIAGLSAAAFLVRDAQMPGKNITVYDQLPVFGGSMDACGNAEEGYVSRGERELEPYMECLWDLFSSIPSLEDPTRSVLDETRECNQQLEINSKHRLWEQGLVPRDESDMGMNQTTQEQMLSMFTTPEDKIENVTIEEWFDESFFESNLWYYWSSMLAFQPYQSLIEMRRYAIRFMHQLHHIKTLKQILRTKHDQYTSLILPLQRYLEDHGVQFKPCTTVFDMDLDIEGDEKTVTALHLSNNGEVTLQPVAENDMVYFTNGSMTQNSTRGSMDKVAVMNRSTTERGCFSLWEKLAAKSPDFGHPEKFISDPDKTNWISITLTVKDYPQLFDYLTRKTGNEVGTGGVSTFVHSPWMLSFATAIQPVVPTQPENVQVMWFYGLHPNEIGTYIKKPMTECTGEEILRELVYWWGLGDKMDEVVSRCIAIPTMMPYITSQFMPRAKEDRPTIIPNGSKNLAFIGQFVELPGDVVFTVETSVRTAMTAVYRMTHLDRPVDPLFEGQYDIRMVKAGLLTMTGKDALDASDLPKIKPHELPGLKQKIVDALNQIPDVPEAYPERWQNR